MPNIEDTVKVIAATEDALYCDGRKREYIPIGTVCTVKEVNYDYDGSPYYGLLPVHQIDDGRYWYYLENEIEKGHMEWIKDEEGKMMKELRAEVILYLKMKDGESEESATERMQKILDENGIEYSCFESSVEDN